MWGSCSFFFLFRLRGGGGGAVLRNTGPSWVTLFTFSVLNQYETLFSGSILNTAAFADGIALNRICFIDFLLARYAYNYR